MKIKLNPVISTVFLIVVICFVVLPYSANAKTNDYWVMRRSEINDIFNEIQKRIRGNTLEVEIYNFNSIPENCAALSLVKNAVMKKLLVYYFKDLPLQISKKAIKIIIKVGVSTYLGGISAGMGSIEKMSVSEANKFLLNFLMENQIKVASGSLKCSYRRLFDTNKLATVNFKYIILAKPISSKAEEVIAEFYSNEYIAPPMAIGTFSSINSVVWRDGDFKASGRTKIAPFIVRARGELIKKNGGYFFGDEEENLEVTVDFDNPVPEIENSDFILSQKPSQLKRNFIISKVIKPVLSQIGGATKSVGGFLGEGASKAGKGINYIFEKVKGIFNVNSGAQLVTIRRRDDAFNKPKKDSNNKPRITSNDKDKESPTKDITQNKKKKENVDKEKVKKKDSEQQKIQGNQGQIQKEEKPDKDEDNQKEKEQERMQQEQQKQQSQGKKQTGTKKEKEITFCNIIPNQRAIKNRLIFNEIAWMGTANSANDEWIELKNISSSPIDLSGWQIINKSKKIKIPLKGSIAPNRFFLLERTDDTSVPQIKADKIYTGSLKNSNEAIYLFSKNCQLEDMVTAGSQWPAGENSSKKTMERRKNLSWQTSSNVGGTPKRENSIGERKFYGAGANPSSSQSQQQASANQPNPTTTPATTTPATTTPATTTPATTTPKTAKIVISEVQAKGKEFVELYNQGNAPTSTKGWYLTYYSSKRDWNKPYMNIAFPEKDLAANKYFLIAMKDYKNEGGYPAADWAPQAKRNLSNTSGSIGVFYCDPSSATTSQEAEKCKIDLVSWGKVGYVKENKEAEKPKDNESLQRKKENGKYVDSDNNYNDFSSQQPTPTNSNNESADIYPPSAPGDFKLDSLTNNIVELSWATSTDKDTNSENISYVLSYTDKDGVAATTTATTTSIEIRDLFYGYNYNFSIKAFDGYRYSTTTANLSVNIGEENPLWQAYGKNMERNFQAEYNYAIATTTAYSFSLSNFGQGWTGTAIDQNKTIYVGISQGLVALAAENGTTTEKWFLQIGGRIFKTPLIGNDGTVYLISQNKILAVSPSGRLRWQKNVNTSYSNNDGIELTMFKEKILYLYPNTTSSAVSLLAMNKDNGNPVWQKEIKADPSLEEPDSPVVYGNEFVFSLGKNIYAFDENGNQLWRKEIPVNNNCVSLYNNNGVGLTVKENNLFFAALGTHLNNTTHNCSDSIYNLDLTVLGDNSTSATTTILEKEIIWRTDLDKAEVNSQRHILAGNYIFANAIRTNMLGPDRYYLYLLSPSKGKLSTTTKENTYSRIIKKDGGLFAVYGSNNKEIVNFNRQLSEIWRYNLMANGYSGNKIYPISLTEDYLVVPTNSEIIFFPKAAN